MNVQIGVGLLKEVYHIVEIVRSYTIRVSDHCQSPMKATT